VNTKNRDSKPRIGCAAGNILVAAILLAVTGCGRGDSPLRLQDLSATELSYVERFVVLERARAVAMDDRAVGESLLDSLAIAWGDSSLQEARSALEIEPGRLAEVHLLLGRILDAERDSLLSSPTPERLAAPLPDPIVAPPKKD